MSSCASLAVTVLRAPGGPRDSGSATIRSAPQPADSATVDPDELGARHAAQFVREFRGESAQEPEFPPVAARRAQGNDYAEGEGAAFIIEDGLVRSRLQHRLRIRELLRIRANAGSFVLESIASSSALLITEVLARDVDLIVLTPSTSRSASSSFCVTGASKRAH